MITIKSKDYVKEIRFDVSFCYNSRFVLGCVVSVITLISMSSLSCTAIKSIMQGDRFYQLPAYESQKRIIQQGYAYAPSIVGPVKTVFFGYDRNKDLKRDKNTKLVGIDLVEYKKMNSNGSWEWWPYLIFCDDDFDGWADRLFIDDDCDGDADNVHNISGKKIDMYHIRFDRLKPIFSIETRQKV